MDDLNGSAQASFCHGDENNNQKSSANKTANKTAEPTRTKHRIPFGMSSFSQDERRKFGENVKLCMAFIDGSNASSPSPEKAIPTDAPSIAKRLKRIGQNITSAQADQLEMLVRLDDLEGWKPSGARHCAAWMNMELGISHCLAWEYLRAGRKLRTLPITTALFRAGQLTWSKIRLLTRVADDENEAGLCHAALDASVSQLERICEDYRWQKDNNDANSDSDNDRSMKQWEARSFTWGTASNGNTNIRLSLPPEYAQAFLKSIEQSLAQMDASECSASQRRADAAVLMAETSLQSAGREMAIADRYQVIVSVDAADLESAVSSRNSQETSESPESESELSSVTPPRKRPTIAGAGPIASETARRIACDCSVSAILNAEGEPVNIGQKSRVWPAAMARAIKARDKHCQYPGCDQTRHLEIHHIQHWADGGSTSVENGACLCSAHHHLLHEGGYRIERVKDNLQRMSEQFDLQRAAFESPVIDVERLLRNSRESFDYVRALSPDHFRFRVVDSSGCDVRDSRDRSAKPDATHATEKNIPCNSHSYSTHGNYSKHGNSEATHRQSEPTHGKSEPTRGKSEPTHEESNSTRGESSSHEGAEPSHRESDSTHEDSIYSRSNTPTRLHSTRVSESSGSYHVRRTTVASDRTRLHDVTIVSIGSGPSAVSTIPISVKCGPALQARDAPKHALNIRYGGCH